jgi:hypothetical protein
MPFGDTNRARPGPASGAARAGGLPPGTVQARAVRWAYPRARVFQKWQGGSVRRAADRVAVRVGRRARGELLWRLKGHEDG